MAEGGRNVYIDTDSDIICQLQLCWHLVAVVQYTFTNKQYTEQHN